MSYIDNNLLPEEQVVYRARLHWIIYLAPIVWMVLAVAAFAIATWYDAKTVGAAVGGLLLLIGLILLLGRWIRDVTSEFAVTSKRVVIKSGLIRRSTLELLLKQVETIRVDQGILARIFGFGTITVVGTGGTREPFHGISRPLEFRRQVQMQGGK